MKDWIVTKLDEWCIHRILVPECLSKVLGSGCLMGALSWYLAEKWGMVEK